jgi:predicted enzyme related to lactoylglutathione lyase
MTRAVGVVRGVTLDVSDLGRAERFWTSILDLEVTDRYDAYSWLEEMAPGVRLILQEVPEPKMHKNRVHLDLSSSDPEALLSRIESLGGARLADVEDPAYSLAVMADPDGNEFCVSRRLSTALTANKEMP